jgi:multicomponent Na+:H+ antiporter subunit F
MNDPILLFVPLLLWTIALGLFHILRSPHPTDRLLAVLLLGTTGIGLTLLFATGAQLAGALDVALVFALLAAVVGVAFLLYGERDSTESGDST